MWPLIIVALLVVFKRRPERMAIPMLAMVVVVDGADGGALQPRRSVARRTSAPTPAPPASSWAPPSPCSGGRASFAVARWRRRDGCSTSWVWRASAPSPSSWPPSPTRTPCCTAAASWSSGSAPSRASPWRPIRARSIAKVLVAAAHRLGRHPLVRHLPVALADLRASPGRASTCRGRRGPRWCSGWSLTGVLAELSYRFVENPIRRGAVRRWLTGLYRAKGDERSAPAAHDALGRRHPVGRHRRERGRAGPRQAPCQRRGAEHQGRPERAQHARRRCRAGAAAARAPPTARRHRDAVATTVAGATDPSRRRRTTVPTTAVTAPPTTVSAAIKTIAIGDSVMLGAAPQLKDVLGRRQLRGRPRRPAVQGRRRRWSTGSPPTGSSVRS